MPTGTASFMLGCLLLIALLLLLRRALARRGSGRLAQVEFRRRHGDAVARLLGGEPDPRPGSPWIAIRVGGRPARMVAAPIGGGTLQAGIELPSHELQLDVFHTSGEPDELELPPGTDEVAVLEVVEQLRVLRVDNVARPVPGGVHVMRVQFSDVEALARQLEAIAPLLERLEAAAPAPQAPNDCAQ